MNKSIKYKPCSGCGHLKPADDQCYRSDCDGDEIPSNVVFSAVALAFSMIALAVGLCLVFP